MPNDPLEGSTPVNSGDPLAGSTPVDMPGSVFDNPSLGQRVKRVVPALERVGASAYPAVAGAEAGSMMGSELGPLGTIAGAAIGGGIGGALGPGTESAVESAQTGEPYRAPTTKEELGSALWNAAFSGGGTLLSEAAKTAQAGPEVTSELENLPKAQQTVKNIKAIKTAIADREAGATAEAAKTTEQDFRNRDFWKNLGLNDQQIDAAVTLPTDAQQALMQSVDSAQQTKNAFQSVVDNSRADFKTRYNEILGPHSKIKVNAVPIGQQFQDLAQGTGQHEITPSFRAFLQRKGLELTKAGDATGPSVGGVPWKHLPEHMQKMLQEQGVAQGIKVPSSDLSIPELRDLRTELRENVPASATNLDKQYAKQLSDRISNDITDALKKGGASPVQIENLKALDQEYGRYQDTLQTFDPRSEKFGTEVGNALFSPMVRNQGSALNLIHLAEKAEAARPGEVMPQLKAAFLDRAMAETRVPGQPFEELKALRKLQETWGGDKELRTVMGAMFGKDSVLADPTQFTKVVEAAEDNKPLVLKLAKEPGWGRSALSSPYIQGMAVYGALSAATGGRQSGLWRAITGESGPANQAMAVASILFGPKLLRWTLSSGSGPAQRAMVAAITNPTVPNAVKFASELTGGMTSEHFAPSGGPPSPQPPPPNPMESAPLPTLDAAWHKARDSKDAAGAKDIRDIVVRRIKAGEWKRLDPNMKRQLAPFIREIGMPNG